MGEGVVVRPDQVSLGVLVNAVPRDLVDEAVAVCGVREKRSDGKLPAHVITYLTLALSLFPDDDYTEVATKVTGSLDRWGCWDAAWRVPTGSAITQARKRLGRHVFAELFERCCGPVAVPQGPGGRAGRVRHPRVRRGRGRRLRRGGEDPGAAAVSAAARRRAAHRRPRVLLLASVGHRAGDRGGAAVAGPDPARAARDTGPRRRHLPDRADQTVDPGPAPGAAAGRRP